MVKLEEVEDEAFTQSQNLDDDEWDTDSDSDVSSIPDDDDLADAANETLADRIAALVDIIPPTQRRRLGAHLGTGYAWGAWGVNGGLRLGWQICVSALLIIVPFSLAMNEDQMIQAEEKQFEAARRENEIMAPGATSTPPSTTQAGPQQPL